MSLVRFVTNACGSPLDHAVEDSHAFVIPDVGPFKGGVLYDKFGNLDYFADVSGLEDLTKTGEDLQISVNSANVSYYMRSKAKFTRKATTAYKSTGIQLLKGAIPGQRALSACAAATTLCNCACFYSRTRTVRCIRKQ